MTGSKMAKAAVLEHQRLSGAITLGNCGEQYVKHR
nr:MAG TPA_asm: hypothetical protein [Caudoviricetes sp.]